MEIGRNQLCPCGSGKKYKKCCWQKEPEPISDTKPAPGDKGLICSNCRYS